MEKVKLIGLSSSSMEDTYQIGNILKRSMTLVVRRYENEIKNFAARVMGLTIEQLEDDKILKSYLPERWSYVRNERFNSTLGIDIKPVKYHLTVEHVLKRIQFLGREIHSNFWVNAMFATYDGSGFPWLVTDVTFPNEADGILDNGGLYFHIQRPIPRKYEHYLTKHPKITKVFASDGSMKSLEKIAKEIQTYYENGVKS